MTIFPTFMDDPLLEISSSETLDFSKKFGWAEEYGRSVITPFEKS